MKSHPHPQYMDVFIDLYILYIHTYDLYINHSLVFLKWVCKMVCFVDSGTVPVRERWTRRQCVKMSVVFIVD